MAALKEPFRTRLAVFSYVLAPLWILCQMLQFDVLAIVCNAIAVAALSLPKRALPAGLS